MILLDSDLDPDPPSRRKKAVGATGAKRFRALSWPAASRDQRLPSTRTLARFLREAQAAVRLQGEVTVLLTTDQSIRKLNLQFRGMNKATDVLSFPAGGLPGYQIAGDLAISVETAMRQAAEQGHALSIEVKILILHGLLHLAGFDHETDSGQMARRERLLRLRLGLRPGLIERSSDGRVASGTQGQRP